MRVEHIRTHFFTCGASEFDVKCKCLHKDVTLDAMILWIPDI